MQTEIRFRWLLFGAFLSSMGNSFVWPLTTVYVHNQLHQSLTVAGVVLLFYSGTNVIGSYLGGTLFDRFDPQRLTGGAILVAILGMGVLVVNSGWPLYPIMLALIGFVNGWLVTMHNSYGTRMRSRDGRYVFNMLYFANNLGMVFGTTIVGPIYQWTGNRVGPLFLLTAGMYTVFLLVVGKYYRIQLPKAPAAAQNPAAPRSARRLPRANARIIWTMSGGLAIIWVMYSQWSSNMSVYITNHQISMTQYSLLWTLNGLLVVVSQFGINWLSRRITNDHLYIYFGVAMLAASFVILPFARHYGAFVGSMVVLTLGEATALPTIPAVVNELSPLSEKGRYQGLLNSFASLGKAIGPLFGGLLIEWWGYHPLFVFCAGVIVLVGLGIGIVVRANTTQVESF